MVLLQRYVNYANADHRKNLELEKIILHEDYDSNTNQHDIALLKLKEPLDLSVRRVLRREDISDKFSQTERTLLT